jgi:hypothetical protein
MDILNTSIDSNYYLHISFNLVPVAIIVIVIILLWILCKHFHFFAFWNNFTIDRAYIGLSGPRIVIKPNNEDRQLAYKLWVELSTRKIGLPIDFDHDVVDELYNSWYEFFRLTRDLIKDIPVSKIRHKDTQVIVNLAIDVLNDGLRPHLTRWQARFRKWYAIQLSLEVNQNKSPQEIQSLFPDYQQMIDEMRGVNENLIKYRKMLERLAFQKDNGF